MNSTYSSTSVGSARPSLLEPSPKESHMSDNDTADRAQERTMYMEQDAYLRLQKARSDERATKDWVCICDTVDDTGTIGTYHTDVLRKHPKSDTAHWWITAQLIAEEWIVRRHSSSLSAEEANGLLAQWASKKSVLVAA